MPGAGSNRQSAVPDAQGDQGPKVTLAVLASGPIPPEAGAMLSGLLAGGSIEVLVVCGARLAAVVRLPPGAVLVRAPDRPALTDAELRRAAAAHATGDVVHFARMEELVQRAAAGPAADWVAQLLSAGVARPPNPEGDSRRSDGQRSR
jgi:hypothetical protein